MGYGFLYGVYPALVAESFGIRGLSQNWGVMSLSSVLIGNFFNISYGRIFDHHSFIHDNERVCLEGLDCYRVAYYVTAAVSFFALVISSWSIKYDSMKKSKAGRDRREESREA